MWLLRRVVEVLVGYHNVSACGFQQVHSHHSQCRPRDPCVCGDDPLVSCSVGRFEFLQPWHQYNAYYEFKKQFFLQKEGGDGAQVPVGVRPGRVSNSGFQEQRELFVLRTYASGGWFYACF